MAINSVIQVTLIVRDPLGSAFVYFSFNISFKHWHGIVEAVFSVVVLMT
jgi:hypothetical protein